MTITGSGCPRARNHGGEERKFSNPMESVEEKYRARWCPVWWDTRDGSSLVGSTTGGSARECGVQGGMEMAEDHRPKGPAVREEVLKSRGGWERDAGPRAGWSTQPDPQEPPRPALPCSAVPQRGSARAFGARPVPLGSGMKGGGSGRLPGPDLGGGMETEGDDTSPGPGIGVKPGRFGVRSPPERG